MRRKYRPSLPTRYLVAVDKEGIYLRETLIVNHVAASASVSRKPEAHYQAKPLNWTPKRLQEFKAALARLEQRIVKDLPYD